MAFQVSSSLRLSWTLSLRGKEAIVIAAEMRERNKNLLIIRLIGFLNDRSLIKHAPQLFLPLFNKKLN